ncbi:cytochrome P450 [Mytilinidion resinicola]|uniref:Cytochrome P450 n=1 Tax=Mytilinidion resinicola TaxID=574789 RepID=A0A6A6YVS5_9PEZI|nr:cytochrome P450 [Mytilinidion resinicola]KAF2812870.1 cytochrome P450 [Mytilinidion resinicola]
MKFSTNSPVLLALCALLAIWITKWIVHTAARILTMRRHGCQEPPKYPHKDPFFGIDLLLLYTKSLESQTFLNLNQNLFASYGKTFRAKFLGASIIKTIDPHITKYVHATHFNQFGVENIRIKAAPHLWGDGITMVDGERWANRRALIKPSFDVVHISNLGNRSLETHVQRLMRLLPRDGSTVDLMPLFKRLSLDTSSQFILGESLDALLSEDAHKEFLDANFYAQRGTGIRMMIGSRASFFHRDQKWRDACQTVNDFLDERVDKALLRLEKRESTELGGGRGRLRLIDEMAKTTKDRQALRFQLQNVLTPALDSPAIVLSNIFFYLSRNLCIESVVLPSGGGRDGRAPLYVQKGEIVEMNFRCMLRNKSFWGEDAEEFRPERWERICPTWEYVPFGGGPRICPAMRLVFTEVAYTVVTIAREFASLESRDEKPWTEQMRATFENKNGAKVALIPI